MARALAVIKALDQSILKEADRENFEQLRKQVSNRLKDLMVASVNQKDEHEIERIAQLFKSVGEQAEGMKHYSHYLMQNKVHKEIDHLIQDMFQPTVSLQGNGESFVDKYQQFSDYYG